MQKQVYEDFKYAMQDTYSLYVGCKYTLGELIRDESIPFKFRLIVECYIISETDESVTLESLLYFLDSNNFLCKILKQLKAKVRVNVLQERRSRGNVRREYVTKTYKIEELANIPPAEKERQGMVVQELSVGKLAMMSF